MREIGVGLLGFGTIGTGVVKGLASNGELIADRIGVRPVIRRVADIDMTTDRGVELAPGVLTDDAAAVVDDPAVDVVIELIGGTDAARDLVNRALAAGKPVVTANKALLAKFGAEIFAQADEAGTDICFGASVGGGIPIIRALREGLVANNVIGILGILNGTCNYILSRMEAEGISFEDALSEAQAEGYAEADPGLDIDGYDTAHKAVILASLAYGFMVPLDAVQVEGIRGISDDDLRHARDLGYCVKLLAVIKADNDDIEVRVHPTLLPLDHMLASVKGVYNGIMVHGDLVGQSMCYGRGAGQAPTASTVIADLVDVVRNMVSGAAGRVPGLPKLPAPARLRKADEITTRYYLRMELRDDPGVLAMIASALADDAISIASVRQEAGVREGYAEVVVVTHRASEESMESALGRIVNLDVVDGKVVKLRIED